MAATPKNPHYIVILCGGTGPRLWPISRASFPKPFLKIFGNQTLLQQTYSRALKVVNSKHIFIITNEKYLSLVKKQIPRAQIISEPIKKNTARAILTATQNIQKISEDAIISTLPSDHYIKDAKNFKKDLLLSYTQAQSGQISLIGIKPNSPDISYGYLSTDGTSKVIHFQEKPTLDTARHLLYQPHTFWNSGIYTFSAKTLLSEFERFQPQYLRTSYHESLDLSIDIAISEKSTNLSYILATFDWNDVGEWRSVSDQLPRDSKNIARLNQTKYLQVNSTNCLVSAPSSKLIGLVGVKDLAIIDTSDGLLICNLKDDISFQVRDLVAQMTKDPKTNKYFESHHD